MSGSPYGETFDSLAHRWAIIENEHDKIHPDRGLCGGVGGCTMMRAAVDLKHEMVDAMTTWRGGQPGIALSSRDRAHLPEETERNLDRWDSSMALYTMLKTLDNWIETSRENHDAMGHRHENRGAECWRQFSPSDIRNMINDVAGEVGITPFPTPATPREDM